MEANIRLSSVQRRDSYSKVKLVGSHLPPYECTKFSPEFVNRDDFQAHIERLGDYMLCGKGVWWHLDGNSIIMHDGEGRFWEIYHCYSISVLE